MKLLLTLRQPILKPCKLPDCGREVKFHTQRHAHSAHMTRSDLIATRIAALRLHDATRIASVAETIRWMGAVQAQDYESGLWAIGVRMQEGTRLEVMDAVTRREILRTWSMRGTWHFVPAEDAAWMHRLMASRIMPAVRNYSDKFGFDEKVIGCARKIIIKALSGGKSVVRPALVNCLSDAGIATREQGGNHLLRHFGNEGLICNGVPEGKEQTFVLMDEWVPKPRDIDDDEALALIILRYFSSHGPATISDFTWWTGLNQAHAKRGIEANGKKLTRVNCDGIDYYHSPQVEPLKLEELTLLPAFDEHLLGYRERVHVLNAEHAKCICPGGNGVFKPTIVEKGRVTGVWKRAETPRKAQVELLPFTKLAARLKKPLDQAAERYTQYLGKPVALTTP